MTKHARSIALASLVLAFTASASAQEREARALFEEGVELYDRGRLAEAEDRFRRSLELRPASSVRYNLAAVLEDTGRLAEARELYLVVADDRRAPADVRRTSTEHASRLEQRLARLTVEITGDTTDVVIRLDQRTLDGPGPHLVDPGARVLAAERSGTIVFRRELALSEGREHTVTVLTEVPPVRSEPDETPLEQPPASGDAAGEWWLWTIVGVAVVALVVGGVLIGIAIDEGRYFTGNVPPGRWVIE